MSVSSITSAFASYANSVTGGATPSSAKGASASALQEVSETAAQTAKEARSGDRVAIKKLKTLAQQQQTQAPASEPGKGVEIDHKA